MNKIKVIISGGGTGGHIFPAISIANAIREKNPHSEILFVGAEGKMEMERVPAAGYEIIGLPVAGLQRKASLKNLSLPFKVMKSINRAKKILKDFEPDVVIGVGGYASAPLLWASTGAGIPSYIQEQNSYAGLTNKMLGKRDAIKQIFVAYKDMERFFPAEKIILTGNPIRKEIGIPTQKQREEGYEFYDLNPKKKTLFIVGGSLGSGTLNKSMKKYLTGERKMDFQIIWQSGKFYHNDITGFMKDKNLPDVKYFDFISRMDLAYAVSDVIISRAGAGTISELCVAGKATIFVPSPNVAEDHQKHNALSLVKEGAAMMIEDKDAEKDLIDTAEALLHSPERIKDFENNILKLAKTDAAERIADEILKYGRK